MASGVGQSSIVGSLWDMGAHAAKKVIQNPVASLNVVAGAAVGLTVTGAVYSYGLTDKVVAALIEAGPDALIHFVSAYLSAHPSKNGSKVELSLNIARMTQLVLGSEFPPIISNTDLSVHTVTAIASAVSLVYTNNTTPKAKRT